jgi:hypothetical protein
LKAFAVLALISSEHFVPEVMNIPLVLHFGHMELQFAAFFEPATLAFEVLLHFVVLDHLDLEIKILVEHQNQVVMQ